MLKRITPILLVLAVVAGLWVGLKSILGDDGTLKLSGIVQAVEVKNGNRFGGRVKEILVKEGDTVSKGQVLVRFDSIEMEAKLAEAEATLSQAQAQLALVTSGGTRSEVGQAKTRVEKAKGELVAVSGSDNTGNTAALEQAKVKLESAQKLYEASERQLVQAESLYGDGIISKNTYDQTVMERDKAKAAVDIASSAYQEATQVVPHQKEAAKAQLQSAQSAYQAASQKAGVTDLTMARANVEKAESSLLALEQQRQEMDVLAPIDGIVSTIAVVEGELVKPTQAIVSVLDSHTLWVDVFVPESDLNQADLGSAVTVKADVWKEPVFQGRVATIAPKSEFVPNSGSNASGEESAFRVKVDITPESSDGGTRLYPGMTVNVTL